ncbi:MAG: proline--tRNA ligase [Anaerolineae bacterium]
MTKLLAQTLRQASTDITLPGYQFLLRGGFVRPLATGTYAFLPLGVQVRRRVQDALVRTLEAAGGQEIGLPMMQPLEVVEQQATAIVPEWAASLMCVLPLATEGSQAWALQFSHEQPMIALMRNIVQSYRQLPTLLYLFWQAPMREMRTTRGLFGGREAMVLDAYSLHQDEGDSALLCQHILDAFVQLAEAADIPLRRVIMDTNAAGHPVGYRLIWPWADGEQAFLVCEGCGWACDRAIAPLRKPELSAEIPQPLEEVATPECKTIQSLCAWLQIPPSRTAKSLFLVAEAGNATRRYVIAVVRGDTELSMTKLKRLLGVIALRPADEEEIRALGAEPGYGSPLGIRGAEVVVDNLVMGSPNLVAGANRSGYHLLNVNYGRDYQAKHTADIAMAQEGDLCPLCAKALKLEHGAELALAGSLGRAVTQACHLCYLDQSGTPQPVLLGRYRFWVDRFIAAAVEIHHDELGMIWPASLAPYDVHLMTLGRHNPRVDEAADALYTGLTKAGVRVLYDDRDERAGVKFYDADLIGLPLRIVVGERGIAEGIVEVKRRRDGEVTKVVIGEIITYCQRRTEGTHEPR